MINITLKGILYLISENTHTITTPIQITQHPQQISQTQINTSKEEKIKNIHSKTTHNENIHDSYNNVSHTKINKHNENIINSGNHPNTTSVAIVEEFPEQVTTVTEINEGKTATKTIRKRGLRKITGRNEQITDITTTQEDNMEPTTTIVVTENVLDRSVEIILPVNEFIIELPEEITTILKETEDGKQEKKTIQKRVLKKKKGSNEEVTEIITTVGDNMEPKICAFVSELAISDEAPLVKELPEQVTTTITENKYGKVITNTLRKRILKKKKGPIEEIVEITTKEETDIEPKTSVVITEQLIEELAPIVEELPEQITITVLDNEKGEKMTRTIRKRILRKKIGPNEQITEIITTHEDEIEPFTTVVVTEQSVNESVDEINPLAIVIEELPEEITTILKETNDGKQMKKTIRKQVFKKKNGQNEEITKITTTEGDNIEPKISVDVTEIRIDEAAPIIEELPEQIMTTITEDKYGNTTTKIVRKRTIKKKMGPKEEITEITTTEESMKPKTFVVVMTTSLKVPSAIVESAAIVEELPEHLSTTVKENHEGKIVTKRVHTRTLRKRQGRNEQITEITTTHEDNMEPSNIVVVTENIVNGSEEIIEPTLTVAVEELPEEITTIIHEQPDGGKQRYKTIRKRVFKKKKGDKYEVTQIITTQEDSMEPKISVIVTEFRNDDRTPLLEELPKQITTTTTENKNGTTTSKTVRKHLLKKKMGAKGEIKEIVGKEDSKMEPETCLMVTKTSDNELAAIVEELPEQISTTVTENVDGKTVTKTQHKRLIRKREGLNEQITEIVTTHEDGVEPFTTVIITDQTVNNSENLIKPSTIVMEELPEEITTIKNEDGKQTYNTIRKGILKKKKGDKEEVTEIITAGGDDMEPEINVFVKNITIDDCTPIIQEMPEQSKATITEDKRGRTTTKTVRKRTNKKKIGSKEEISATEKSDTEPKTFVMVKTKSIAEPSINNDKQITNTITKDRGDSPTNTAEKRVLTKEKRPGDNFVEILSSNKTNQQALFDEGTEKYFAELSAIVEELPEQITTSLTENNEGKTITKTVRKRTLRKRRGRNEQITEITTTHIENQEPSTVVVVKENILHGSDEALEPTLAVFIEELPEEITTIVKENDDGRHTSKTIKKRVLKKKRGTKEEVTEIITTEEDDLEPKVCVFVTESKVIKSTPTVEELPEHITTTITTDKSGKITTKNVRKRILKKKMGPRVEITEIITKEESEMEPETHVRVTMTSNDVLASIFEEFPANIYTTVTKNGEEKPVLREKRGRNEKITEITKTFEGKIEHTNTVVVQENILDESSESIELSLTDVIEELPEQITTVVHEANDGKRTTKTIRKRTLKKKKGSKEEVTEIITTEGDDKVSDESVPKIEELPEQVKTIITEDKYGLTSTTTAKRRIFKKRIGLTEEITEIITKEETNMEPEIFILVKMKSIDEPCTTFEELPEKIGTTMTEDTFSNPASIRIRKQKIKKPYQGEETEIVATGGDDMEPEIFVATAELKNYKKTSILKKIPKQIDTSLIPEGNNKIEPKPIEMVIGKLFDLSECGHRINNIVTPSEDFTRVNILNNIHSSVAEKFSTLTTNFKTQNTHATKSNTLDAAEGISYSSQIAF